MKVVALISGGKDSCYAMMKCLDYGHEIVALANLMPSDDLVDELDSYMYQTVGHQIAVSYANCMGMPLFRRRIQGSTRHKNLDYKMTPGDEVEDMFVLLNEVKRQIPSVDAVSSGAIASDYQRLRVESVCSRLGLVSLAYLWKQDQSLLLQEMVANGIKAITVKVAAIGLDPAKHLGKEIAFLSPYLHKLKEIYGINICGEGGEYETLTLDCPLFVNARIVVDEFKVILHSSDSIAPVGVLHPLDFHLEKKEISTPSTTVNTTGDVSTSNNFDLRRMGSVSEVQGDCFQRFEAKAESIDVASIEFTECKIFVSRTKGENTYSLCCWLQNSSGTSAGLREDMNRVLKKMELQLLTSGLGWDKVLYIHLYIDDMNDFALANETYVRFITQAKCHFGVPSRSTIQLPLLHVGLGRAYIEALVADNPTKRVLHVQSISCWAPSCIGPYSQASLYKEILHMAGQLGLDPPTMALCEGGLISELKLALANSEAVAKCFNCSLSSSAIQLTVYCSIHAPISVRTKLQAKRDMFLEDMRCLQSNERSISKVLETLSLYVLVPDLPKRASVEVKPILYVEQDMEHTAETVVQHLSCSKSPIYLDSQEANWHYSCFQKCIVQGKICALLVHITDEIALEVCSESFAADQKDSSCQKRVKDEQMMERIAKFCIHLLDRVLMESDFAWEDVMNLRLYFPTSLGMPFATLSRVFSDAFGELAETSRRVVLAEEPIFNLVPVLAAGRSAASMDDLITCELLAQKE